MADEEIIAVSVPDPKCFVSEMWCVYRNSGKTNCQHPELSGKDIPPYSKICTRPNLIFIKRHDLPKYIAIKLIG